jgi:ribosomal protein S21
VIAEVVLERGEDVDFALKRLKKLLSRAGVFGDLKRKSYFQSRSVRRRFKSLRAQNKVKKAMLRRAGMIEVKSMFTNGGRP